MKQILRSVLAALLICATFVSAILAFSVEASAETSGTGDMTVIPGLTDDLPGDSSSTDTADSSGGTRTDSVTVPETNTPSDTGSTHGSIDKNPSSNADDSKEDTSAVIGIVIAIIAVVAIVILIVALVPKKKK